MMLIMHIRNPVLLPGSLLRPLPARSSQLLSLEVLHHLHRNQIIIIIIIFIIIKIILGIFIIIESKS